jgi:hypothetical protein
MPKRFHSTLILVVVFGLGLAAGVAGMVWAWPGVRDRLMPHRRQTFVEYLQHSLQLTPAQVPQIEAVINDTRRRGHTVHMQYVPAYTNICEQFLKVSQQEHTSFLPVRQQELSKLQAIMTPTQWRKFQQMRAAAAKRHPPRKPDLCRHLPPLPAPGGKPAPAPK